MHQTANPRPFNIVKHKFPKQVMARLSEHGFLLHAPSTWKRQTPAHPNLMQFKPSQAPSTQQWREPYMFANSRDGLCRGEAKRPKQRNCQRTEGCFAGFGLKKPTVGFVYCRLANVWGVNAKSKNANSSSSSYCYYYLGFRSLAFQSLGQYVTKGVLHVIGVWHPAACRQFTAPRSQKRTRAVSRRACQLCRWQLRIAMGLQLLCLLLSSLSCVTLGDLAEAAADGDAARVQELIDDGADVNKDGVGSRSHAAGHDHIDKPVFRVRMIVRPVACRYDHAVPVLSFTAATFMNCPRPAHEACTD